MTPPDTSFVDEAGMAAFVEHLKASDPHLWNAFTDDMVRECLGVYERAKSRKEQRND